MASTTTSADPGLFGTGSPTSTYVLFPTASVTSSSSSTGGGVSSSLYLFTFLTTFILLLVISLTLFLRALILRRRYRRSIEASIVRNGGTIPSGGFSDMWRTGMIWDELERTPDGAGSRRKKERKDYGPVPTLWEAELREKEGLEGEQWSKEMQPVSILDVTPEVLPSTMLPPPSPPPTVPEPSRSHPYRLRSFLPGRFRSAPPTATRDLPPPPPPEAPPVESGSTVEMAVVIALPRPDDDGSRQRFEADMELPDLVFGVTYMEVVDSRGRTGASRKSWNRSIDEREYM